MIAIRSAMVSASSWSCVTITVVIPSRLLQSPNSACISWRKLLSSAPNGSSSNNSVGWMTSARANATRCCWPPEAAPAFACHNRRAGLIAMPPQLALLAHRARCRGLRAQRRRCRRHSYAGTARNSETTCRYCGDAPAAVISADRREKSRRRSARSGRRPCAMSWSCRSPKDQATPPCCPAQLPD